MNTQSLADTFIMEAIANKTPVACHLVNGVRLEGKITATSQDSFTLTRAGITQLVMFHALSTVLPVKEA